MLTTLDRLKSELEELLVTDQISDTDTLASLGADSLDLFSISRIISDEFSVHICDSAIHLDTTVAELAALIEPKHLHKTSSK